MKLLVIIILAISIIFYSCEKTVEIPIPDNGRKLVVNSFFEADNSLTVSLTKSKYILDASYNFDFVSNAAISLYENNVLLEKLIEINGGMYTSNSVLLADKEYSIIIDVNNFEQIKAFNTIPLSTEISKFNFINYTDGEYGDREGG